MTTAGTRFKCLLQRPRVAMLEGGETLGRSLGPLRKVFDPVVLDSVE